MGVVHQQGHAAAMGRTGQGGNVQGAAQVVGAGDEYRRRVRVLRKHPLKGPGAYAAAAQGVAGILGVEPGNIRVQKGGGGQKGLVGVAPGDYLQRAGF